MNTYQLTETELQELFKKKAELCAEYLEEGFSDNPRKLLQMVNYAPDPPLPKKEDIQPVNDLRHYLSWAERWMFRLSETNPELFRDFDKNRMAKIRELLNDENTDNENCKIARSQSVPSKSSQKQSLIEIPEADQKDGIYGVMDNAGWISVKDKLPSEGGRYWCYVKELTDLGWSYFQWNCSYHEIDQTFTDRCAEVGRVTHWMPLPPPPNSEQEDKRSVATMSNSSTSPDPQNTTKEPVIDWEGLEKEFKKALCYERENDYFGSTTYFACRPDTVILWLKNNLPSYIK